MITNTLPGDPILSSAREERHLPVEADAPAFPVASRGSSRAMLGGLIPALKHLAHRSLQTLTGCDVVRYHPNNFQALRRSRLIRAAGITCVLDVGANTGQYGKELRETGYIGRLVSFEPMLEAFQELTRGAARDKSWECIRIAIGSCDGTASLNVSANHVSSSILPLHQALLDAAPDCRYVRIQDTPVRSLDSLADTLFRPLDSIWLKLDVQGFERQVLDGAKNTLTRVQAVEVELSLRPLYEGQTLYLSMIQFMEQRGFALASLAPGFLDERTGRLLQFDGIFLREGLTQLAASHPG
jgi:FkbM family methyltransferase